MDKKNKALVEVWAGIECTINRVGDQYYDQLADAGSYHRPDDIQLLASAGVRCLRFPVLWEKHEPVDGNADWGWTDEQMQAMRAAGIQPIVGLLHHGSGPRDTSLADMDFPERLAAYAAKVAARYPWVERYTPVNEPLTTARFSGLYGFWYPHATSDSAFCRMLVNQVKATVLSMQAIRRINPHAQLVQTEDLAKVHSTAVLRYQRDFENHRRWISYDLLCGMINTKHPLWNYLVSSGIAPAELRFFIDNPCRPDIAGFNHYVTSERWLDHRLEKYPAHLHGGNGKHQYVDTEAVRAGKAQGLRTLLQEAWQRYQLPMALTEVHLGCTREEQLRWFRDAYHTSIQLAQKGIDIRAVTVWSAFGAFDWNSLLTRKDGVYEPGAFDLRGIKPRPTALAGLWNEEKRTRLLTHPAVAGRGWWVPHAVKRSAPGRRPVLILGKTGTLGGAFERVCGIRNLQHFALSCADVNIRDNEQLEKAIRHYRPWAVINATGYVRIDEAENDAANCFAINTTSATNVARACAKYGLPLVSFSSDQVFNGDQSNPYTEADPTQPLNVYGRSKAMAEEQIKLVHPEALMIRTSAFFGPWDRYNFAWNVLQQLSTGGICEVCDMGVVSPTYVPDLVQASLDLLLDGEYGIWHLSNKGAISWHDFARWIAERGGHRTTGITINDGHKSIARRPAYSALTSEKGMVLPSLDHAVEHFFASRN